MARVMAPGLSALLLLLLAPPAGAADRSALDREHGLHFRLDGRVLLVSLAPRQRVQPPDPRRDLWGQRIRAACSWTYRARDRRDVVAAARRWPHGAHQVAFFFDRDISRSVKWCLVEETGGGDIGVVGFEPPPVRLFVQTIFDTPDEAPPPGIRMFLRLTNARGEVVLDRSGSILDRLFRPGRYRLTGYQRRCLQTCAELGPPRLRCSRSLRLKPRSRPLALAVFVNPSAPCRIET